MSKTSGPEKPYAVGYGKPPAQHRFKKGRSGNPNGRPRKAMQVRPTVVHGTNELVIDEANRIVSLREGDKTIELPVIRAVVRALGVSAIKGNRQSQLAFKQIVDAAQAQAYEERLKAFVSLAEYKATCELTFQHCDQEGRPRPDLLPHPDDVIIDWKEGEAFVVGPWDAHHRHKWNSARSRIDESVKEIASLKRYARQHPEHARLAESDIEHEQHLSDMIELLLPGEATRRSPAFDPRRRTALVGEYLRSRSQEEKRAVLAKASRRGFAA